MARDSIPQPDVALQDDRGNISPHWYDALQATRQRGVDNTLGLETLQDQIAGKQPLNANLSAIAQLIGSGFLRRDSNGTWSLAGLTPDEMLNPFATYLVDENGDYLVDEDGNFLVSDDGDPVPLENGGTGAALVDPNADRMYFWDDSLGSTTWLAPDSTLTIAGTDMGVSAAYDALLLHKAGAESITGNKTFVGGAVFSVEGSRARCAPNSETYALQFGYNPTRLNAGECAYIGASNSATPSFVFSNVAGTQTGEIDTGGSIKVGTPSGGTATFWKFGEVVTAAAALDATRYVRVEIGGVAVKLAVIT